MTEYLSKEAKNRLVAELTSRVPLLGDGEEVRRHTCPACANTMWVIYDVQRDVDIDDSEMPSGGSIHPSRLQLLRPGTRPCRISPVPRMPPSTRSVRPAADRHPLHPGPRSPRSRRARRAGVARRRQRRTPRPLGLNTSAIATRTCVNALYVPWRHEHHPAG